MNIENVGVDEKTDEAEKSPRFLWLEVKLFLIDATRLSSWMELANFFFNFVFVFKFSFGSREVLKT